MKTIAFILFMPGLTVSAHAQQLTNPNFEDWVFTDTTWDGQPVYAAAQWHGATRTNESYTGNYAASVVPKLSCGIMPGYMIYGTLNTQYFNPWTPDPDFTGSGSPIQFKPTALSGYFKFKSPVEADSARGTIVLRRFNAATQQSETIGQGEITFTPSEVYAPFTVAITYTQQAVTPDSIIVLFSSGMGFGWNAQNNTTELGTLFIDQLRMQVSEPTTNLPEKQRFDCVLYPNPTSEILYIQFTTGITDDFQLLLTDASGRTVVQQTIFAENALQVDLTALSSGNYRAIIRGKQGVVYTERTIVKH